MRTALNICVVLTCLMASANDVEPGAPISVAVDVRNEDLLGKESYLMPNGQPRTGVTFRIRSLRIGPVVVENIRGSVLEYSGPALLGMSFLSRFSQWSVDNARHVLILH